jgi:hypothetical protein
MLKVIPGDGILLKHNLCVKAGLTRFLADGARLGPGQRQ